MPYLWASIAINNKPTEIASWNRAVTTSIQNHVLNDQLTNAATIEYPARWKHRSARMNASGRRHDPLISTFMKYHLLQASESYKVAALPRVSIEGIRYSVPESPRVNVLRDG